MQTTEHDTEIRPLEYQEHWHALYTRHQHEKSVAESLLSKGHRGFLPIYEAAHRWRDRTKRLLLPLFPTYVFIHGGMDRQLQILSTPGLIGIVGRTSGRPGVIPADQIAAVRRIVEGTRRFEPHPFPCQGDRIRVQHGPLLGVEGILVRKKGLSRLVVSMEILGRSAAVEIDTSDLAGIGKDPSLRFEG